MARRHSTASLVRGHSACSLSLVSRPRRFFVFIRSRASPLPFFLSLSIKIPRPRETIVSWTSTRTTFQGRSIRRLSYFYYRLVPLSRSIHLDKDRGLRSVAKNRRGGKASELLRNASFGGNRSVVVSMGGEEEEAWQSGLGIAEGGRLESWKRRRVGQSARLTYARCKFLSIVRYDVRWLALAARSSFDFGVVSIRPRRGIELRVVWKSSRGLI